jgi:hypothetical protein
MRCDCGDEAGPLVSSLWPKPKIAAQRGAGASRLVVDHSDQPRAGRNQIRCPDAK